MSPKKIDLYRGFNVYADEIRAGVWSSSVMEVTPSGETSAARASAKRRIPGEHPSKESVREAARAYIDRIHTNRKNRAEER